jgi:hypothetical protein
MKERIIHGMQIDIQSACAIWDERIKKTRDRKF